jgi:YHS domain-containing protein
MKLLSRLAVMVLLASSFARGDAVKLDAKQQASADQLKAKGALVMPLAADNDGLVVSLALVGKAAGDAELALVKDLPKVTELNLAGTAVTDAGLANLEGMNTLTMLHLEKTGITDAGLSHLKGLGNLTYLNLYNTGVSDTGVTQLSGLKNLRKLYLWETKVSDAGAAALKKANPELAVNRGEEAKAVAAVKVEEPKPAPKTNEPKAAPKPKEPKPVAKADASKPINTICPVSGEEVDPAHTLVYEGKVIGFCCDKCPAEFQKDPKKFMAKLVIAAPAPKPQEKKPEPKPG